MSSGLTVERHEPSPWTSLERGHFPSQYYDSSSCWKNSLHDCTGYITHKHLNICSLSINICVNIPHLSNMLVFTFTWKHAIISNYYSEAHRYLQPCAEPGNAPGFDRLLQRTRSAFLHWIYFFLPFPFIYDKESILTTLYSLAINRSRTFIAGIIT